MNTENYLVFEQAVYNLCKNSLGKYDTSNGVLTGWYDTENPQPTTSQIDAEIARINAENTANEYKVKRAAEYPPMADYLDGIVKSDQDQIDKYIADCLAVKAKYPKG